MSRAASPSALDKRRVLSALRDALRGAVDRMTAVARDTAEGATHEEARSEGDKDMRATEQSYVARGQAMRAEDLADSLARLERFEPPSFEHRPLGAGALVEVDVEGERRWLFLLSVAGGTEVVVDGRRVFVVTPTSPVGRQLVGKEPGDAFDLAQAGRVREWTIERAW
jgi:transcription elongation GreA/GreB family factor